MRVLILNQTFYPDVASSAQLAWDVARHLESRGHEVSAVASRSFYGTTRLHQRSHERVGRIDIHRVRGTSFGKGKHLGRLMDFGTYYAAGAWQLQHVPCPDVIVSLTSPPMIATLAMLSKQFRRTPRGTPVRFVYHIMDLYPDAAVASGIISKNLRTDRAMRRLTARTLELADAVIVLGRDMKQRLIDQYAHHARAEAIHVIPPWADGRELFPLAKQDNPLLRSLGLGDSFNVVYSGNFGIPHDGDTLVAAMHALKDDPAVRWLFIGGGMRFDDLQRHATRCGWTHVRFLPFQERHTLNQSLNLADVHLVTQLPAFTGVLVPSKLFGILAVGKPSIMVGPADAECARILAESGAGFVVPNNDSALLVERLRQLQHDCALRQEMGRRARATLESRYDRSIACDRIETVLRSVV